MAVNVYPYVRNYLSDVVDGDTIEKFATQSVTFEDVKDYRLPWDVRFRQILRLIAPVAKTRKVVLVNSEGLRADFESLGYNAQLAATYNGKAEYYVVLAGEVEVKRKLQVKYFVWSFIYEHPLANFAAHLRFDIQGGVFPTQEEVTEKLSAYMVIRQKSNDFEGLFLLHLKPNVPTYVNNQLLLMKELFLARKGDSYLKIDGTYTVQRVEFVYIVNVYLASLLQRWMKDRTLANWTRICAEIKWDL